MSTNHTSNYGLCQWEAGDRVLRTDFNADNAKIDAALAGKAGASELDSLSKTVNSLSGTVSSQGGTLNRKGNCQVYVTTYTGNGSASRTHYFSNRPLAVLIQGADTLLTAFRGAADGLCITGDYNHRPRLSWGDKSVTVTDYNGDSSTTTRVINGNQKNYSYCLVAFLEAGS